MISRPVFRLDASERFRKSFSRLPKQIQKIARKKDKMFRGDAFHPLLKTHKLRGELKDDWAYSVNHEYRVHFYFVDDHTAVYLDIGTHEIYK